MAFPLLAVQCGCHVFRVLTLFVVLTMAGGPNAFLFCRVWCDVYATVINECHHADPGTARSVGGADRCSNTQVSVPAVLPDPARPGVTVAHVGEALVAHRYQLASSMPESRSGQTSGPMWTLASRPLSTTLRI